jgi:hypothetical protein
MPYASNRDRNPSELEYVRAPWPVSPLNFFVRSGYRPGVFDLTWDSPGILTLNGRFSILGVNIYRAFDSEFGPFERVNSLPIGSRYWRDQTNNVLVTDEQITPQQWVIFGEQSTGMAGYGPRYVFRTLLRPIVKEASQEVYANSAEDVQVIVDGQIVPVLRVDGQTGEIEIDVRRYPDTGTQNYLPTVVPSSTSVVTCSYRYTKQLVRTDLVQRVFYLVTTVGIPVNHATSVVQSQKVMETPLEYATATNSYEMEKIDYIWKEAARRNRWLLEQAGERVKVFLRKQVGTPCPCFQDDIHKQPINDDPLCFGTGIIGGYDGPYDIIIAPDDSEKRITQKDRGRTVEHTYESWTGPTPLLAHRDFFVKINGERYSIGAVRMPTSRGMILQQHFTVGHFDEKDIRNKVPVDNPVRFPAVEFAPMGPDQEASSEITNKPNIPAERQLRGETDAWENTEY